MGKDELILRKKLKEAEYSAVLWQDQAAKREELVDMWFDIAKAYEAALKEVKTIVSGNYECLDPQAKEDIFRIVEKVLKENK